MKRSLFISSILLICICFSACGGGISSFKDVQEYFDTDIYVVERFTDAEIRKFQEKRLSEAEILGKPLTGEIEYVVHAFNKNNTEDAEDWAYIVQYKDENGAIELENMVTLPGSRSTKCKRFGKVIVYGNSPVIDEIEE